MRIALFGVTTAIKPVFRLWSSMAETAEQRRSFITLQHCFNSSRSQYNNFQSLNMGCGMSKDKSGGGGDAGANARPAGGATSGQSTAQTQGGNYQMSQSGRGNQAEPENPIVYFDMTQGGKSIFHFSRTSICGVVLCASQIELDAIKKHAKVAGNRSHRGYHKHWQQQLVSKHQSHRPWKARTIINGPAGIL